MKAHLSKITCLAMVVLPLATGCRRSALDRLPVHGAVSLPSGEKLNGSITFTPASGQSGPSASGKVVDGAYQFDRTNGPTAGPHNVSLRRMIARSRSDDVKAIRSREPGKAEVNEWSSSADLVDDGKYLIDVIINQ